MARIGLREFTAEELILDEEEAKQVLVFFFPADGTLIEGMSMTASARAFAQGLLVEAIDRSYAMGYVEALFSSIRRRPLPMLRKFARKASAHWFKHATLRDLMNAKIYETVRQQLSANFRFVLPVLVADNLDVSSIRFAGQLIKAPKTTEVAWC